jgi:hypothetical protein
MAQMKNWLVSGTAAVVVSSLAVTPLMAAQDNFNRKNLGRNWVVPYGALYIVNDKLRGQSRSLGYDKLSSADSNAQATITLRGTILQYGAVAIGDIKTGRNVFVKIQESSGGGVFDLGAFYTGNNGSGIDFRLQSLVPSPAVLNVKMCGTIATMTIKSAAGTQRYKFDYHASFPAGGGLGTYGPIALDNYVSRTTSCGLDERAILITHSTAKDPVLPH